jgi:hypothetical protein
MAGDVEKISGGFAAPIVLGARFLGMKARSRYIYTKMRGYCGLLSGVSAKQPR